MGTSSVTQKGQVTIPVEIRRALGLKTGSKVRFRRHGRKVTLEAVDEPTIDTVFGIDFADAVALADAGTEACTLYTFDRKLAKLEGTALGGGPRETGSYFFSGM